MQVREVDVRQPEGAAVMAELRNAFHADMSARYPGSDYGPGTLPAGLHPPDGAFLVLYEGEEAIGCVGVRALPSHLVVSTPGRCAEGKSLFVRKEHRSGNGALLLGKALISKAQSLGYQWLYGNTGKDQPESQRFLSNGRWNSEQIPLYDPANPLAAYAYRVNLQGLELSL